ncbi:hypothetical protein Sta7437_0907 [Stanieria cyanosphaera PCC 7437]|uniref:Uncharacterized protein n=1 Tax=Stanieria cyanosphaera (strain ATCC 29371 / PCC 7437) TaxID=111780 RepID=K9XPE9_STAC7|nr:hypothetical protein Sta7437_0907 [Stanieria cyanosphaera PCC 7437]
MVVENPLKLVTYSSIEAATKRLQRQAHRTPVLTSTTVNTLVVSAPWDEVSPNVNQLTNAEVFFKNVDPDVKY